MDRGVWAEAVAELSRYHAPTPDVAASTRLVRQARAVQLDEVATAVDAGAFYSLGFRSPTDWLATTTREGVGQCRVTLHLADRIRHMPIVREAFGAGDLAESALRLLADAWSPEVADVFARDEEMLCRWATTLSHKDFKFVLDTWRLHADSDQTDKTARGAVRLAVVAPVRNARRDGPDRRHPRPGRLRPRARSSAGALATIR